jgi:hypothetical protein
MQNGKEKETEREREKKTNSMAEKAAAPRLPRR